jgi:hypothetical protein
VAANLSSHLRQGSSTVKKDEPIRLVGRISATQESRAWENVIAPRERVCSAQLNKSMCFRRSFDFFNAINRNQKYRRH